MKVLIIESERIQREQVTTKKVKVIINTIKKQRKKFYAKKNR